MVDRIDEDSEENNLYNELTEDEELDEREDEPDYDEESDEEEEPDVSDDESIEESGGEDREEEESEEEEVYTPEELRELSRAGQYIDPSKVPSALRDYHKALQADYTRKTQDLADAIRSVSPQQPSGNYTAQQLVSMGNVQGALAKLNEDYYKVEDLIDDAEAEFNFEKKKQLKRIKRAIEEQYHTIQSNIGYFQGAVDPDIVNQRDSILNAINMEAGVDISPHEIDSFIVNHPVIGVKIIKALAAQYKKRQAVKQKEVKRKPNEFVRSSKVGSGLPSKSREDDGAYRKLYKRAEQTGDKQDILALIKAKARKR